MKKLNSLRAHILDSGLGISPESLLVFVEDGKVNSRRGNANNHFEIKYKANIILTNFAGIPEQIYYIILMWMGKNQPYHKEEAINFDADILGQSEVDLALTVEMNEIYKVVIHEDGRFELVAAEEPDLLETFDIEDEFGLIINHEPKK